MASATIILLMLDGTRLEDKVYLSSIQDLRPRLGEVSYLVLLNKADLLEPSCITEFLSPTSPLRQLFPKGTPLLSLSAKEGLGIDELRKALVSTLGLPHLSPSDLIVSNAQIGRAHV